MTSRVMDATKTLLTGVEIPALQSDLELVALAQKQDSDAFGVLVERHQRFVYNVALRIMKEPSLAEDMAQEAFLKAYRLLGSFRGDSAFSTWLYRVTANVCLSEIARRNRGQEVPFAPEHDREIASHAEHAENNDLAETLARCVTRLSPRYKHIITLYYFKEKAYDEIAQALKVPIGTLKTWMYRARTELKRIVEEEL